MIQTKEDNNKLLIFNILIITFFIILMIIFNIILYSIIGNTAYANVVESSQYRSSYLLNDLESQYERICDNNSNLASFSIDDVDIILDRNLEIPPFQINKFSNFILGSTDDEYKYIYFHEGIFYYENIYENNRYLVMNKKDHDHYIIDKEGFIIESFYRSKIKLEGVNIKDLLLFEPKDSKYQKLNNSYIYINNNTYITFEKLGDFEYYFVQVSPRSVYYNPTLIRLANALLVIVTFVGIGYLSYILSTRNKKANRHNFNDIILSKYKYLHAAIIDSKGNFIQYNDEFKKRFIRNSEKNINKFFYKQIKDSSHDEMVLLLDGAEYNFSYLNYGNNTLLIGENRNIVAFKNNEITFFDDVTRTPNFQSLQNYLKTLTIKDKITLISIDIKQFTQLTIIHGHEVADKIIKFISSSLYSITKDEDTKTFHTSTDVFIVSFETIKAKYINKDWIKDKIEVLTKDLADLFKVKVEFRIGILVTNEKLLENPKMLYYKLKEFQRVNKEQYPQDILIYDEVTQIELLEFENIKLDIEKGIINNEFEMYLQPILNLRTNKINSYESLLRWNNPKYKDISPQVYIEIAEKNDLIYSLGNYIIKKIVNIIKEFNNSKVVVSVNISPLQLIANDFVDNLITEVRNSKVSPSQIILEITESSFIEALMDVNNKIIVLKNAGFIICLDDFGTGYSSLKYLNNLSVDVLKIDRSFINNITTDPKQESITSTIIHMAKDLDLEVVAEGIETIDQFNKVKDMGVNSIQGYLISKPIKVEDAKEYYGNEIKLL